MTVIDSPPVEPLPVDVCAAMVHFAEPRREVVARIADLRGGLAVIDAKIDFRTDADRASERAREPS